MREKIKRNRTWRRTVSVLACVVVFVVTYALILPAITLEENKTDQVGMIIEEETELTENAITVSEDFQTPIEQSYDDFAAIEEDFITEPEERPEESDPTGDAASGSVQEPYAVGPLSYDTDLYTAYVQFDAAAELPGDTQFTLLPAEEPDAQRYLDAAGEKAGIAGDITAGHFYSVSFTSNGRSVIPLTPVDITIQYKDYLSHPDETVFAVEISGESDADTEAFTVVTLNTDGSDAVTVIDDFVTALNLKEYHYDEIHEFIGLLAVKGSDAQANAETEKELLAEETSESVLQADAGKEPEKSFIEEITGEEPEDPVEEEIREAEAEDPEAEEIREEEPEDPETEEIREEGPEDLVVVELSEKETEGAEPEEAPEEAEESDSEENPEQESGEVSEALESEENIDPDLEEIRVEEPETEEISGEEPEESALEKTPEEAEGADAAEESEPESEEAQVATESEENAETCSDGELLYTGSDYTVSLTYTAEAQIPEDATVSVRELEPGTAEYEQYLASAKQAMGLDESAILPAEQARFFDITILDADGETELEPKAAVTVRITYDDPVVVPDTNQMSALHFVEDGAEPEILEFQNVQTETTDETAVTAVAFDSESFSVFGIVYTVEFEYTGGDQSYRFSISGGSVVFLDELFVNLGIHEETEDIETYIAEHVQDVRFSDDTLVNVEKVGQNWKIHPLKPFDTEETLTVELTEEENIEIHLSVMGELGREFGAATITSVDELFLPEDARGCGEIISGETSIAVVEEYIAASEASQPDETDIQESGAGEDEHPETAKSDNAQYAVFDISIELTEEQLETYENGFQVDVSLPEAVIGTDFRLYHIHEDEITDITDSLQLDAVETEKMQQVTGFSFVTDGFSEFVLRYTVDFYYDGFEYHISGGSAVSLSELVELLNIAENGRAFVADVAYVSFSAPELVYVGKAEQDTTIGSIRQAHDLVCEYSAQLTEEEIKRIDAEEIAAGDWALISLKAFSSTESLTIITEDGMVYVVKVEDNYGGNYYLRVNDKDAGFLTGQFTAANTNAGEEKKYKNDKVTGFTINSSSRDSYGTIANANAGYRFVWWLRDDFIVPNTNNNGGTNHTIAPNNNEITRNTAFIAYFVPSDSNTKLICLNDTNLTGGTVSVTQGSLRNIPDIEDSYNLIYVPKFCYSTDNVTFTATQKNGYLFKGWYNGNTLISDNKNISAAEVAEKAGTDVILTPKFSELYSYTVTVNDKTVGQYYATFGSNDNKNGYYESHSGTGVLDDDGKYCLVWENSEASVKAGHDTDYRFACWLRDDGLKPHTMGQGSLLRGKISKMSNSYPMLEYDNTTFVAFFTPVNARLVVAAAEENGSVSSGVHVENTSLYYGYSNADVTFTATPASGYVFKGWYNESGKRISQSPVFTVKEGSVATDTIIKARFENTYEFSLITNIDEAVNLINSYDAIQGTAPYTRDSNGGYHNLQHYFKAVPGENSNYHYVYWLKDDSSSPKTSANIYLRSDNTIDRDTTFIAWFAPAGEYIVRVLDPDDASMGTASYPSHRTVSTDTSDIEFRYYFSSDEAKIKAEPKEGYLFAGWYNGSELISTDREYSVRQAAKNMVLKPVFEKTYVANVVSNGEDYGGYFQSTQFKEGEDEVTFTEKSNIPTNAVSNEACTKLSADIKQRCSNGGNSFIGWMLDDGTIPQTVKVGGNLSNETRLYRDTTFVGFFGPKNAKVIRLVTSGNGRIDSFDEDPKVRSISVGNDNTFYYLFNTDNKDLTPTVLGENNMFVGWYIDGVCVSRKDSFNTLTDLPESDAGIVTLEARFRQYYTFDASLYVEEAEISNVGYMTSSDTYTTTVLPGEEDDTVVVTGNQDGYFSDKRTEVKGLRAAHDDGAASGRPIYTIDTAVYPDAAEQGYRFAYWVARQNGNVLSTTTSLNTNTSVPGENVEFVGLFAKGYIIRLNYSECRDYTNVDTGKTENAKSDSLETAWGTLGVTGGSVRSNHAYLPSGAYVYSSDNVTLTATAKEGYSFIGWFNGQELISSNPEYEVSKAKKDMVLTPVFGPASDKWLVWFDGTNGIEGGVGTRNTFYARYDGNGVLNGAQHVLQEVDKPENEEGTEITLPGVGDTASPMNDNLTRFKLQGWYNVYEGTTTETKRYFSPGDKVHITGSTVFYADWFPDTSDDADDHDYNIGLSESRYNHTSTDTSDFITTYMYDYNSLFNLQSISMDKDRSTISKALNYEYWVRDKSGYDFVFITTVSGEGRTMNPEGRNAGDGDTRNRNFETTTNGTYYSGIPTTGILSTNDLQDALFSTSDGLGKRYVGTGNYLYTYDPATGYYYYDSDKNAASYNAGDKRFYLYNYRNMTNKSEGGDNADFLPFNYGKSTFNESNGQVNYWFGMQSQIDFYLPNETGYTDSEGNFGNQSTKGKDMVYKFAGDDDVWVFVDGKLVLDMGGIHGKVYGEINFSTGDWAVVYNGATKNNDADGIMSYMSNTGSVRTGNLDLDEGDHTLTLYYLERGSSQSNCAIYFNLAPRYKLKLHKTGKIYQEDGQQTGTEPLPGVLFGVYSDEECTVAANVKDSEGKVTNLFTTDSNGYIDVRSLGAGKTYYIREIQAAEGYPDVSDEVITLVIPSKGVPSVSSSTSAVDVRVTSSEDNAETAGNFELGMEVINHKKVSITAKKVWSLLDGSTDTKDENAIVYVKLQRKTAESTTTRAISDKKYTVKLISRYYADANGDPINTDNARIASLKTLNTSTTEVYEGGSLSFNVSAGGTFGFLKLGGRLSAESYEGSKGGFNLNGSPDGEAYSNGRFTLSNITSDRTVYITFIGQELDGAQRKDISALERAVSVTVTGYTNTAQEVTTTNMTEDNIYNTEAQSVPLSSDNNWTHTWEDLPGGYYYYVVEDPTQLAQKKNTSTVASNPLIASVPAYVVTYSSDGLLTGGTITVYNTVNAVKVRLRKQDDSGSPLQGVRFKIFTEEEYLKGATERKALMVAGNNQVWLDDTGYYYNDGTFVTDSQGRFYAGYLPLGTYYIEEITPEGYEGLKGPAKLEISGSGLRYWLYNDENESDHYPDQRKGTLDSEGYYNLSFTNVKQIGEPVRVDAKVTVNKIDPMGETVTGATFTIYDSDAFETATKISTYTGGSFDISTADSGINDRLGELGTDESLTLYLKETAAPAGYILSDSRYRINILKSVVEKVDVQQNKFVTTTTYTMAIEKWDEETKSYVAVMAEASEGEKPDPAASVSVVNTPRQFTIVKVSSDNQDVTLAGAEFKLTKMKGPVPDEHQPYPDAMAVGSDGRFTFTALPEGVYKLEESHVPDGYIKTEGPYYIKVAADGVTALADDSGKELTSDGEEIGTNEAVFTMIQRENDSDTYKIGNTPGVALPSTGGPGTLAFYLVGSLFILAAGFTLVLQKKEG